MNKRITVLLCIALSSGCLFLAGCADADQSIMDEAQSLYSNGEYDNALSKYLEVPEESELRQEALEAVCDSGVELFDSGEYEVCKAYMESLVAILPTDVDLYHEAYNYIYPAEVLDSYLDGYTVRNWIFDAGSLSSSAKNGSVPAQKALETGYLDPYLKLHEYGGLWRSENTATDKTLVSGYEVSKQSVYTYIFIDDLYLKSANYDAVTVSEITGSMVSESDEEHHFEVTTVYDEATGTYRCDGRVNASVASEKWVSLSFDMRLDDNAIHVENVETSSSEYPFASGAYTKDFAQEIQPIRQ